MEQFDIIDRNGIPIGLLANKGTLLQRGQYYLGVHAYIFNSSKEFLVQQRSFTKEFLPGGWMLFWSMLLQEKHQKKVSSEVFKKK